MISLRFRPLQLDSGFEADKNIVYTIKPRQMMNTTSYQLQLQMVATIPSHESSTFGNTLKFLTWVNLPILMVTHIIEKMM